jgi:DNA-3-methyladenine glycosylase
VIEPSGRHKVDSSGGEPVGSGPSRPLSRERLVGPAHVVAPQLLNLVLRCGSRAVRIVEVEAYGGEDDPASHAHRGPTRRNGSMFAGPGTLYVYFTYGMHWCANVVCGPAGEPGAVLVRAGEPVDGIDEMWDARPAARKAFDLTNGPAKLCAALGIGADHDGTDLLGVGPVWLLDHGWAPPTDPVVRARIGITKGADEPWRWYVPDDPYVSIR